MKRKIIIAGAILIVLVGGVGIKYAHSIINKATHTSSSNEYYYNDSEKDDSTISSEQGDILPARDKVNTTPDSIYCLVNKEYSLPSDYEPKDLVVPDVSFSIDYESEKKYMRKDAAKALESLCQDALSEGLEITAVSGYRSYERQQEIYENNLKTRGTTHTNQYSAKPGYSEHQTGLVMDVSCKSENYDLQESFGETPEGIWLAANCMKYGFIIRYPEGKEMITGYAYEPWHIRYVGIPLATYLTENNLTLDEYYYYEPSFDFITDESEYINDIPSDENNSYENNNYNNNSTIIYSPTPSASANTSANENSNSGNTSNSNNNNDGSTENPTTTVNPVTPSASIEPSMKPVPEIPEVDIEEPKESAPVPTETTTPSPSASASTTPSVTPSQTVPSPSPSASVPSNVPSTEPQPDEEAETPEEVEIENIIE